MAELGVVSFFAAGEMSLRAAASKARKWTERLRIAQRSRRLQPGLGNGNRTTRGGYYSPMIASADAALRVVEEQALTPEVLAGGEARLLALARKLEAEVANITLFVEAASARSRDATIAAPSASPRPPL